MRGVRQRHQVPWYDLWFKPHLESTCHLRQKQNKNESKPHANGLWAQLGCKQTLTYSHIQGTRTKCYGIWYRTILFCIKINDKDTGVYSSPMSENMLWRIKINTNNSTSKWMWRSPNITEEDGNSYATCCTRHVKPQQPNKRLTERHMAYLCTKILRDKRLSSNNAYSRNTKSPDPKNTISYPAMESH